MMGYYEVNTDQLTLRVFVQPKSSKTAWDKVIEREEHYWIRLKISAPPVDGAANRETIKFLSKTFKTAKSNIRIIQGVKSRFKVFELERFDKATLQAFVTRHRPARN